MAAELTRIIKPVAAPDLLDGDRAPTDWDDVGGLLEITALTVGRRTEEAQQRF